MYEIARIPPNLKVFVGRKIAHQPWFRNVVRKNIVKF